MKNTIGAILICILLVIGFVKFIEIIHANDVHQAEIVCGNLSAKPVFPNKRKSDYICVTPDGKIVS